MDRRLVAIAGLVGLVALGPDMTAQADLYADAAAAATATLVARHGDAERPRITRGVTQVRRAWRAEDGDAAAFRALIESEFLPAGAGLDAAFVRLESALESVDGYFNALGRDLRRGLDLAIGPELPIDGRLGAWDPSSHVTDDLFSTRIAFVVLLNFPRSTLAERLRDGQQWSRRQWAETRLTGRFALRVPAAAQARLADARAAAEGYINGYNLRAHHLLAKDGRRLFRPKLRLLSHWNLRDEIKAAYADADGLDRQRVMVAAMDAIVRQTIPAAVIDNPALDWTPETGAVAVSPVTDDAAPAGAATVASTTREADVRYARWKALFDAERDIDRATPDYPTLIDRKFEVEREIPLAEVERLLRAVLEAPVGARVGGLITARLKRALEPHDIWYAGFKPSAGVSESALDAKTRQRYPTAEAFAADLPRILTDLGFAPERATFLADRVVVDPARGSGHALGARRRDDKAHLRTRVNADGMDYKGYNIAVHELGHNIEQVFSLTTIDHTLLQGVPNNAFTEALAFLFQQQDMALLGTPAAGPGAEAEAVLEAFWNAREIAGVSLVDIGAWRWLYAHPEATPAEFREAVVGIARDVWNQYFAALHGRRDATLLAIYSHMVSYELYTPDYALAHLVAFQIRGHFDTLAGSKGQAAAASDRSHFGREFERVAQIGAVTPNEWMRQAVGAPLSATPLLEAAEKALGALK
ncbi:MAG: hypothetical protein ABIT71_17145 [Vicinamibacteraceae bacterium]